MNAFRTKALKIFLALQISVFLIPAAYAQSGSISGVLVDGASGETLIGANVILRGTSTGSTTDLDGRYSVDGIAPGTYAVVYSYIGYRPQTVEAVQVGPGEVTRIDLSLQPASFGLNEVIVEAAAIRKSEAVLLRERQKSAAFSDAISAEAIGRSGAPDAAAAMSKVTGATVVGGKYVYVRGLGDRYSSTQLNGIELPSADPDRKAFQLDLIPSSLLDNIITTKTFTPDKSGSFSGGLVNMGTMTFPERLTVQLSSSVAYVTGVTGSSSFLGVPGANMGLFGFNRLPSLPSIINEEDVPQTPSVEFEARRDPEIAARIDRISRAFSANMVPLQTAAPVNRSLSAAFGNSMALFGRPLGFSGSLTYNQEYASYSGGAIGRYRLLGKLGETADLTTLNLFDGDIGSDTRSSQQASWGAMATVGYKPHRLHEISSTVLLTRSASAEARSLNGYWEDIGALATYQTRVMGSRERDLSSVQVKGEHALPQINVKWNVSLASNAQDEPDLRYMSNHYIVREQYGDTVYLKPPTLYPAPTRFFRNMEETHRSAGLDLTVPFARGGRSHRLKAGGTFLQVQRTFSERRFEYREGKGANYTGFYGNNDGFFSTVGVVDTTASGLFVIGNYIIEAPTLKNNYTGGQTVAAAYGMADVLVARRLRLIGGARIETTRMETVSADSLQPVGSLDDLDVLPSLNVVYALRDNMNLRAAATRTLARPTFRELAPYGTFDFVGDFTFEGNASLGRTLISNFDLRWEWFTRPGEIVGFSGFFKKFADPIERVIDFQRDVITVQNVREATVYGIEIEARKRLDWLSRRLANFQIGANASIVRSAVSIPKQELAFNREEDPDGPSTRRFQGQSPYVLNANLSYENPESGTAASLYYNTFGERLSTITLGATPDVFEEPRNTLDLLFSQRLPAGLRLKIAAKNVLNADVVFSQRFKGRTYDYQRYATGRVFSVGVSYAIN